MRTIIAFSMLAVLGAAPASAQLADQLSRGQAPNALDRAASQPPLFDGAATAAADQRRADDAARTAQTQLGPVAGSTMTDGPSGVQGTGSSVTPASPAPPTPPQL